MANSLVGDHQVAVVNVDEGVLEGSDMSGTLIIINVIQKILMVNSCLHA